MLSLGLEGTAHTLGVSVVGSSGKILSNPRDIYKPKEGWGIIPMDCAKHHEEVAALLLKWFLLPKSEICS